MKVLLIRLGSEHSRNTSILDKHLFFEVSQFRKHPRLGERWEIGLHHIDNITSVEIFELSGVITTNDGCRYKYFFVELQGVEIGDKVVRYGKEFGDHVIGGIYKVSGKKDDDKGRIQTEGYDYNYDPKWYYKLMKFSDVLSGKFNMLSNSFKIHTEQVVEEQPIKIKKSKIKLFT